MQKLTREITFHIRRLSARKRVLPDFVIAGTQKGGTTSLYSYLEQHPQLHPSLKKEIRFFDGRKNSKSDVYHKEELYYRAHFPKKDEMGADQLSFEASPGYMFNPPAPARMKEVIPEAKIIILLRDPVERAISHYFHSENRNREPLPILEALKAEEERLEPIIKKEAYRNAAFREHSYKKRGLYKEQLDRIFRYFPREQVLIRSSEEFFSNTPKVLSDIYDFLGVDTSFADVDLTPKNTAKKKKKVGEEVYDYLRSYFQKPNEELFELLGYEFDWMHQRISEK